MEDRGGRLELVLPYATLEPVRELLLQMFVGEKFGRDSIWEVHLANEMWHTDVDIEAVLDDQVMSLGDVMDLKVGSRLMFNVNADPKIDFRCGGISLLSGRMGRKGDKIAVLVEDSKFGDADAIEQGKAS
jgi:flagellar motor switch protein FliM